MANCTICGTGQVSAERIAETGKTHCMATACINTWRQRRIADTGLRLVNVHKQGPRWMHISEVPDNSMRRTGAS